MTILVEKRRDMDLLAGFLVVVLGLAAWRGAEGAPVMAGLAALGAAGVAAAWIAWRRHPASMLTVSPDEIVYGRLDQPGTVIARSPTARLELREGFKRSGWFLGLAGDPDAPSILLTGFDLREVRQACEAHGWTFGEAAGDAPRAGRVDGGDARPGGR